MTGDTALIVVVWVLVALVLMLSLVMISVGLNAGLGGARYLRVASAHSHEYANASLAYPRDKPPFCDGHHIVKVQPAIWSPQSHDLRTDS